MNPAEPAITLHEGRHLRFVRQGRWEFVERVRVSGIVVIVAVTDGGRLLVTEQFRPPVGRRILELPAGLAGDVPESAQEALAEAARRELLEETGYAAREMEYLTTGTASAGVSSEVLTLFRARGLTRVGAGGGDASEAIQVHEVPLTRAKDWLQEKEAQGVMVDVKVWAGLHFVTRSGVLAPFQASP